MPENCSEPRGELVILVGMQGAGKTYYCETVLSDYERISQDEGPRAYPGILLRLRELLDKGAPRIVIDRTNPRRHQREDFAVLARGAGYRLKIIYLDAPADICRERILKRQGHPTLTAARMQPAIARYSSDLDIPTSDECDELQVLCR
jgi:predicted kinase